MVCLLARTLLCVCRNHHACVNMAGCFWQGTLLSNHAPRALRLARACLPAALYCAALSASQRLTTNTFVHVKTLSRDQLSLVVELV